MYLFREGAEDGDSQGDGSSQPDTISIASRTSQNTVDSDKVGRAQPRCDELMACSCLGPHGVSHAVTVGASRGLREEAAAGLGSTRVPPGHCGPERWRPEVCVRTEVVNSVNAWPEKELVMKELFRLCTGVCASEAHRAPPHVQVSQF